MKHLKELADRCEQMYAIEKSEVAEEAEKRR